MTQIEYALENKTTEEMKTVVKEENIDINVLRSKIAEGQIVIPANINHKNLNAIGIGKDLTIKVNANIGTSQSKSDLDNELLKLKTAVEAGADTMMDLSTSNDVEDIRNRIIENCTVPIGTVPIYQTLIEAGSVENLNIDAYLEVFEKHAKSGVDFATVHAGLTRAIFPLIKKRLMKCVSRGGSFLLAWMKYYQKENFLYENYDKILEIAKKYDVTISLGDGMRPGCIADATDEAQIHELKILGELAERTRQKGVQVMIEGPGHIPLNEIEKNMELEKKYCNNSPFYVLGPLPTDIATGYDHIACAIGGALAASKGADFLCYVTPKEHIGLPDIDDVREGVVVTKIAAHIADIAKGNKQAISRDNKMAHAREEINWQEMSECAIDKKKFLELRRQECEKNPDLKKADYCSMCGPFCVFKIYDEKES